MISSISNLSINDLNGAICKIILIMLIAFFIIGYLITSPLLKSDKKRYKPEQHSQLFISSLVYVFLISKFNTNFAIIFFIIASAILFIDYLKYISKLIVKDIYNDEVVSLIFYIMATAFSFIVLFSSVNDILFLWFEFSIVILFFVIDVYYFMYMINKIFIKLLNTNLIIILSKWYKNLSTNVKLILNFVFSPILILKMMHLIIKRIFYNKSILYYLHSIIAFSSIFSFILVYVLSKYSKIYAQSDIDMYVVLISAIIIPILLSQKKISN